MISNGHYSVDTTTGNNVYYIQLEVNSVLYAVQTNTDPVTPVAPTGIEYQFTAPTQNFNPIVVYPANFSTLVGYSANFTTTESTAGTNLSFVSSVAPQIQPSPTLLMSVNCVFNKFASPPNILFAITPNVNVGANYFLQPFPIFAPILGGQYRQIRLQLMNTNYLMIPLADPNVCIVLQIKENPQLIKN